MCCGGMGIRPPPLWWSLRAPKGPGRLRTGATNQTPTIWRGLKPRSCSSTRRSAGTLSQVSEFNLPDISIEGPATIKLAVNEITFSTSTTELWLFCSVWLDDRFLGVVRDDIAGAQPGVKFGIAVTEDDTSTAYSGVRIADLSVIVPYATLDPDEVATSAINRALADRVIRSRPATTVPSVRGGPRRPVVKHIFSRAYQDNVQYRRDIRELINHIRLYYLLSWVDAFDSDMLPLYGHRFREISSAVIESEAEAYTEAQNIMRWAKEKAFQASFTAFAGGMFLEPEDRVTFPDGVDYLIDSLSWEYKKGRIFVTLDGRQYSYEIKDQLMPREAQRLLDAITRQIKEVTEPSLMPGEAISLTPDGKFCRVRLTGSSRMVKAQMMLGREGQSRQQGGVASGCPRPTCGPFSEPMRTMPVYRMGRSSSVRSWPRPTTSP